MIILHRLNKEEFVLNSDLIETIESTPDTIISLTSGKKLMVRDPIGEVVEKIVAYRRRCYSSVTVLTEPKDRAMENNGDQE